MKPTSLFYNEAGLCPQKINKLLTAQTLASVITPLSKVFSFSLSAYCSLCAVMVEEGQMSNRR